MEAYSSTTFFAIIMVFAGLVWGISKKFPALYVQYLMFAATIASTLVFFKGSYKRIFVFTLFYLVIIKLALKYKNIPKKVYVLASLLPLLIFKGADLFPALGYLQGRIAFVGLSYISFRVIQILLDLDGYAPKRFSNVVIFLINPLTMLAGPIDRFQRFEQNLEQINNHLTKENFLAGWYFLLWGVMQKFILAYFWDIHVMSKFSSGSDAVLDVLGTAYTYTVYLFLDFSGYSLMAMGLGYMMGVLIPANFDRPWLTKNPQDMWRRFHITLGTFLNDYFFKPIYMAFMRKSFFKSHRLMAQNIALFLTFLLMGAWNGLKWYYLLSGAMFGLASLVYNTYQSKYKKSQSVLLKPGLIMLYRFFFFNYVVWALYFFSGKLPL